MHSIQQPSGLRCLFSSFAEVDAEAQSLQGTRQRSCIWHLVEPQFENLSKVCECDVHVFCLVFASHSLHIVKYLRAQMRGRGKYTRMRVPGYWFQPPARSWQGGVWHSRAMLAVRQGGISLQSQEEPDSLASQWLQYNFMPGKMLNTLRDQVTLFQCTGPGLLPGIGVLGFFFY